jgi:hypothetical protein
MFEHRSQPLLSRVAFTRRMLLSALAATLLGTASLLLGACGYHWIGGLDWIDGFLNAAMILSGEGPVDPMRTTGGKLFATAYSLFSGVMFLTSVAVLLAPLAHRILHRLHLEGGREERDDEDEGEGGRDRAGSVPDGGSPGQEG